MTSSIFPSDLLDTSFKAIAPLAVDTDWLGHEIRDDFVGVKTTLFIKAPHKKLKRQEFNLSWSALQSDYAVRAAYSGFGISLAAASGESKRAAVYSAYEISTIDEIDTTQAFMVPHQNGFTPVRIYRGWSLNVLVEGESSNFSLEAAAGLLGARARVEAQAAQWSARAKFNLRGLKRKNSNAIVIPRDIDDIKADFEVDGDNPAPIFVEYVMVGSPLVRPISWANFRAPEFWAFDGQWAQYRVYRDPRVPPGQLSLDISNPWPYDWAVFEIWRPGTGQHSYRWELGAGQMHRGDQIPLPDYPLQLVWVGHKTLVENAALDPNFGWRLDFVRTR